MAATATAKREEKAVKMLVVSGPLGLFFGESVSKSTGASLDSSLTHCRYYNDHFVPLLSTSYA